MKVKNRFCSNWFFPINSTVDSAVKHKNWQEDEKSISRPHPTTEIIERPYNTHKINSDVTQSKFNSALEHCLIIQPC